MAGKTVDFSYSAEKGHVWAGPLIANHSFLVQLYEDNVPLYLVELKMHLLQHY